MDVYIATYSEPVDLVRLTADATTRLTWPNTTVYMLGDGARPTMKAMAKELNRLSASRPVPNSSSQSLPRSVSPRCISNWYGHR